jgi:hypothetical protein
MNDTGIGAPTPEEALMRAEYWAEVYRREHQWARLYTQLMYITDLLQWFPNIVADSADRLNRYAQELRAVEQMLADKIFTDEKLLSTKMSLIRREVKDLFDSDAPPEEIRNCLRKFLVMGYELPEALQQATYVAEDIDRALLLWEAHLCAVQCYALIYDSGFYRPPFSVASCRIPEWVVELWESDAASEQQRACIANCLLRVAEISERLSPWVALEDWRDWFEDVRQWLRARGQQEAAERIARLMERVAGRQRENLQEYGQTHFWLLPKPRRIDDA